MDIVLPDEVKCALEVLYNNGFKAYVVGGCVRDSLLGSRLSDFDIATDAEPFAVKELFFNYKVIETGIKHGTVTVNINNLPIEITTFRSDGEYINNRKPKSVNFVKSLKEDVSRRDFTINALAYNFNEGIIDYFDGISDINNKIIRCVGVASERFYEDALRILRALRFASVLGFNIEEKTKQSIFKNAHLLKNISKERITSEFVKLLCGINATAILKEYQSVISVFFPMNDSDFYFLIKVKAVKHLRLAGLFYDLNIEAEKSKEILLSLKFDNNTVNVVYKLLQFKNVEIVADKKQIKKNLLVVGEKLFADLVELKCTDEKEKVLTLLNDIIVNNECYNLKGLDISGDDLMGAGIPQGKIISVILNKLLFEVIEEKTANEREKLIGRALQLI